MSADSVIDLQTAKDKQIKVKDTEDAESPDRNKNPISIKNSLGVITLSDDYPSDDEDAEDKRDYVKIYNKDESLWYEFTYYYDDSDGKFEFQNDNFRPFAFHSDYFLLGLKCVGEDKKNYRVVVNEEKGIEKYIRKSDKIFKLQSWQAHIKEAFSIDINKKKTPVYESPKGKEIKIASKNVERFEPVEINDDWLKITWENPEKESEMRVGWVRWKKSDIILIDWFYFA